MAVSEAYRFKECKEENRQLKSWLLTKRAFDIQMLKKITIKKWSRPNLNVSQIVENFQS